MGDSVLGPTPGMVWVWGLAVSASSGHFSVRAGTLGAAERQGMNGTPGLVHDKETIRGYEANEERVR